MLSVVGVIKTDANNPVRQRYKEAAIRSLDFLDTDIQIFDGDTPDYGAKQVELVRKAKGDFILNFIEDAFMVEDDKSHVYAMLQEMHRYGCRVMRASFHDIEQRSASSVRSKVVTENGLWFDNDQKNFSLFQQAYGVRYYIGVNMITTKDFALRFWNRKMGYRPHPYEVAKYSDTWHHKVYIPGRELLASIDDSHGESSTSLVERKEPKFERIYDTLIQHK